MVYSVVYIVFYCVCVSNNKFFCHYSLYFSLAVCTLSYTIGGFIVSGSWDKTARVWSGQQCVLTLQGHLEAVWATDVFPTQNLILTGSADHTIRLWRNGTCERVFTGKRKIFSYI